MAEVTIPTVVTKDGLQPQTPQQILTQLLTLVADTNPGYTATLPGSLIEDISSTDVGALTIIDQARVELVNSMTPYGANAFLLNQLGNMYGVTRGVGSNTSVYVVFTGLPGFVIGRGFTVSDGNYQYAIQDGGIIGTSGTSSPLFALSTRTGSWAVAPGTVTQLITSVPSGLTLTVVNQVSGVPGAGTETEESYRSRVLQAGLASSQGMLSFMKTLLTQVSGVQQRLISARKQGTSGWEIIVGGGDPYEVAYAIYYALFDVSTLVGSTLNVLGITHALPGVVTTDLNHGYVAGDAVTITGALPVGYNSDYVVVSTAAEKTFVLGKAYAVNLFTNITWSGGDVTATTTTAHGITVGSTVVIVGNTAVTVPNGYNGTYVAIAGTTGSTLKYAQAIDPGVYSVLGQVTAGTALFDATTLAAWTSGGVLTPNERNIVTTIVDWPDSYSIPFVNPPLQTVAVSVLWNTSSVNYVSSAAISQLGTPAIVDYINSITVGLPINVFDLEHAFQTAIQSVLPSPLLTRMVFSVSINGVGTAPTSGTLSIVGDPESYFYTTSTDITITQG